MRRVLLMLVLALACRKDGGSVQDSTKSPAPRDSSARRKIIFAGTSLTAGLGLEPDSAYPNLIQEKLDSAGIDYQAVNAGVSGETTAGLLQRLRWARRRGV